MVRDLVETSVRMVKAERMEKVKDRAEKLANERLVTLLAPSPTRAKTQRNPLEMLFGGQNQAGQEESAPDPSIWLPKGLKSLNN